jgi:hypothetical protein
MVVLTVVAAFLNAIVLVSSRIRNSTNPSFGTMTATGVDVCWDEDFKNQTREIRWGAIYAGAERNVTLYMKSLCKTKIILDLTTANWILRNPEGEVVMKLANTSGDMNLTWSYDGRSIKPNEVLQVTLNIQLSSAPDFVRRLFFHNVSSFSFDIFIRAVEGQPVK